MEGSNLKIKQQQQQQNKPTKKTQKPPNIKKVCSHSKHIFPQDFTLTRGQNNRSGVLNACASISGLELILRWM